jgi:hypothetical protein
MAVVSRVKLRGEVLNQRVIPYPHGRAVRAAAKTWDLLFFLSREIFSITDITIAGAGTFGTVLKNPGFTSLLIVFSLVSVASLAFIADSSYIYEDGFGLSEQWFSFYFAINAIGMISGPLLYLRLSRSFSRTSVIVSCFATIIAGGALIASLAAWGPCSLPSHCSRRP